MMKRILVASACLLVFYSAGSQRRTKGYNDNVIIVTSDVSHFWQAFDQLANQRSTKDSLSVIQQTLIDRAGEGLKQYMQAANCYAPQFLEAIRQHRADYLAIRSKTLGVVSQKHQLLTMLSKFKRLYPPFKAPSVYFAIGKFEVGGTAFGHILYIGCEMDVQHHIAIIPQAVHEIAHSQQQYDAKTNLQLALIEGGAEFVAHQVTGGRTIPETWTYGLQHEHALWQEFKTQLDSNIYQQWFLDKPDAVKHRPGSLAYFVGYRICEAYYNKQADKRRAFAMIVEMKTPEELFKLSGYDP